MKKEIPYTGHSIDYMKSVVFKPTNRVRLDLYTKFEGDPGAFSLLFNNAEEVNCLIAELQKIREFFAAYTPKIEQRYDAEEARNHFREERIARDADYCQPGESCD